MSLSNDLQHYRKCPWFFFEDEIAVSSMLELLSLDPIRCFDRNYLPGHFTASGFVVDKTGSKFFMVHHRKLKIWVQPGGHADGEWDLKQVALKEVQEESGLVDLRMLSEGIFDVDIHYIPPLGQIPGHYHYDVRFCFQENKGAEFVCSEESLSVAWMTAQEVTAVTTERSVVRMVEKWNKFRAEFLSNEK